MSGSCQTLTWWEETATMSLIQRSHPVFHQSTCMESDRRLPLNRSACSRGFDCALLLISLTSTGQIHYQPASGSSTASSKHLHYPDLAKTCLEERAAHRRANSCIGLTTLHNPTHNQLRKRGGGRTMLPQHPQGNAGIENLLKGVFYPTTVFNGSL